jgi:exodeoxyribonuclease VII large subunit
LILALDLLERAKPDVIIFGRGGGSQEDLMAFNDEAVVRRVARCSIPLVSAVGHEIDTSLTDLVADARAATPSQAAEMVVPDRSERLERLESGRRHLSRAISSRLMSRRIELDRQHRKLGDPRFVLADAQQALDELRLRLARRSSSVITRGREVLESRSRRLYARHPRAVLASARVELGPLSARLKAAMRRRLDGGHSSLSESGHSLSALSPLSILGRGYALATGPDGSAIRDAGQLTIGGCVEVRVQRGTFEARVEKVLSMVENATTFDHESPVAANEGKNSDIPS